MLIGVPLLALAALLRLYLSHTKRPAPPDGSRAFDGTITSFSQVANGPDSMGGCAMKTLRHIMRHGFLFMLQRDTTVADACRMMAAHNVGIVAVLDGERLCGVFSERDVTQRVVDRRLDPARTQLEEVMTSQLVVADADEDYQSAMNKMDQANIRHLPVVSGDRLLSMLSIRDLMRVAIEERGAEIEYLKEYLYQVPPSGR
jgi:predicted transcriptional regulator